MSEFLTLNGVSVEVSASGIAGTYDEGSDRERAFSGRYLSTVRYSKKEWSLTAPLLPKAFANALKGLLRGDGHYWSFNSDLYSSKGLGPQVGYTATHSASGGKYGGKVNATSLSYSTNIGSEWTVLVYRYESATWKQYAVQSDGSKWINGIRDDTLNTTWLAVNNSLTLSGSADYDDLVALPYLATADIVESFMTLTAPFSSLPRLNATGDMIDGEVECIVERMIPFKMASGILWSIEFRMMEV